ncbi:MAG: sensor histidine kinase, partial [Burkholderiales bacterium]
MSAVPRPRLASRLLSHVLLPLTATWLVGTAVTVGVANHYAGQAFDRALLDDAWSVAANVRPRGSGPDPRLDLMLTPREVSAVLFDSAESIFFAVLYPDGSLVAGHPGLHAPAPPAGRENGFFDIVYQGRQLRAVRLSRPEPAPFDVVMAQTTNSRTALLKNLLLFTMLPQALLLALLAAWLQRTVRRELAPLSKLHQAVDLRDANDLAPLVVSAPTREIERLGAALNALLARVAASVRAQREFSGNVAHELRTPLAGIRAQAEYALAHDDPAVWREQLLGIAKSETRASHQIDQLLLLSIGEEARARLELVDVHLDELVRDVVLRFMPRAIGQGVDLGAEGLDDPAMVRGNAGLIEGLLANLIDNALRHGTSAEPTVTVALSAAAPGGVRLTVTDNGPGMAPQDVARMMQRGVQGGPAGQRLAGLKVGAGLGLAIALRYAELLGA